MWNGADGSRLLLVLVVLLGASGAVLVLEAHRPARPATWSALTGGLGTCAQAGTDAGWFLFDARLESQRDSLLGPAPGVATSDGARGPGALELAPFAGRPPR